MCIRDSDNGGRCRDRTCGPIHVNIKGLSSVEEDDSGGELNSGEKISGEFVVACGDGAKVLEFVEEALDKVAFAIECEVAIPRRFAVGFWGNHRGYSPLSESVCLLYTSRCV